jgi:hypothetical protein
MAKRPPAPGDLTSQLGSLLRSTWKQLDPARELIAQKAREGKRELDLALLRRRQKAALADLGAAVLELVESGKLDEGEHPELSSPLARLSALADQIAEAGGERGESARSPSRHEEDEEDFLDSDDAELDREDEKKP